jgi:DNA-binding NtrC family response regulator
VRFGKGGVGMDSVLIVDDEVMIREMLARILKREEYDVREAPDADAALDILSTTPIGVVLCDRTLPGRDGDWLIEQLRKQFPDTAIILATGDPSVPPSVSLQTGVVGYIVKPFTAQTVRDAVRDAMLWHRTASRNRDSSSD